MSPYRKCSPLILAPATEKLLARFDSLVCLKVWYWPLGSQNSDPTFSFSELCYVAPLREKVQVWSQSWLMGYPRDQMRQGQRKHLADFRIQCTCQHGLEKPEGERCKGFGNQGHSWKGVFIIIIHTGMMNSDGVSKPFHASDLTGVLWCGDFTSLPNPATYCCITLIAYFAPVGAPGF